MSFGMYAIQFYIQSSLPLLRRFLQVSLCYISINKRMNSLELNMKPCKPENNMLCTISINFQQLFHLRLDQIWLDWLMFGSHNPDWNSSDLIVYQIPHEIKLRLFQELQKNSPPKWKAYFV